MRHLKANTAVACRHFGTQWAFERYIEAHAIMTVRVVILSEGGVNESNLVSVHQSRLYILFKVVLQYCTATSAIA